MPNERRHFPVSAGHRYAPINPPREVGNTVLEIVMSDLHDVTFMLDNGNVGAGSHFSRGIP